VKSRPESSAAWEQDTRATQGSGGGVREQRSVRGVGDLEGMGCWNVRKRKKFGKRGGGVARGGCGGE